jgi:hypothetical protein
LSFINIQNIIINNQYLILNKLGSGSYCTVWNVYDVINKKYDGSMSIDEMFINSSKEEEI